jgi:hypothetical protein
MPKDVDSKYPYTIPTPYVVMEIGWGEKDQHVHLKDNIAFFSSREEANDFAHAACKKNPMVMYVVAEMERVFQAQVSVRNSPVAPPTNRRGEPMAM